MNELGRRLERLERLSSGAPLGIAPRINLIGVGDLSKPLLGYRVGDGDAAVDLMRAPGESDAAMRERAFAFIRRDEDRIVATLNEIRGR